MRGNAYLRAIIFSDFHLTHVASPVIVKKFIPPLVTSDLSSLQRIRLRDLTRLARDLKIERERDMRALMLNPCGV